MLKETFQRGEYFDKQDKKAAAVRMIRGEKTRGYGSFEFLVLIFKLRGREVNG